MQGAGMLVVLVRGANLKILVAILVSLREFWVKTPSYLAVKVSFIVALEETLISIRVIYAIHVIEV